MLINTDQNSSMVTTPLNIWKTLKTYALYPEEPEKPQIYAQKT